MSRTFLLLAAMLLSAIASIAAAEPDLQRAESVFASGDGDAIADWLAEHQSALSAVQQRDLLFAQIRSKRPRVAELLLDGGFDAHAKLPDGTNASMLAAYYGDAALVARFVEAGADPLQRAANGYALFDYALESTRTEVLQLLIERWLVEPDDKLSAAQRRERASLQLARAIIDNDLDRLGELARQGGVNTYNRSNYAPLPLAVRLDRAEAVQLLLAAGAYPSIGNDGNDEAIPLNQAARGGRMAIAKALLQWQASPNKPNGRGYTALMLAGMYGHLDMLKLLIDHGGRLQQANNAGDNAVTLALQTRQLGSLATLLDAAAEQQLPVAVAQRMLAEGELPAGPADDLNRADPFGIPLGAYSLLREDPSELRALLERGADANQKLTTGSAPSLLHLAVTLGNADAVSVLLDAGADQRYQDRDGRSPLALARFRNRTKIAELLEVASTSP